MPESWSGPLEQRFDRLLSTGRQLVNGVSGGRPGSRGAGRRPKFDGLGRWVENKLDWILEDEDDFREPWQEPKPVVTEPVPPRRRPLEAISRRSTASPITAPASTASDWPDDDAFTVPRWQRQAPGRAMPRSTRRRAD